MGHVTPIALPRRLKERIICAGEWIGSDRTGLGGRRIVIDTIVAERGNVHNAIFIVSVTHGDPGRSEKLNYSLTGV